MVGNNDRPIANAMLPGAPVHDMRSTGGHDYRIFVWQPEPRPRRSLPARYLLGGNGMFPIATAALALQSCRVAALTRSGDASLDVSFRVFGEKTMPLSFHPPSALCSDLSCPKVRSCAVL
ncbi:hypothetical protein CVM73_05880 [Bradyrhizobium forestalis]|uniref:Uncharacterized protein n=1 Tax=Bradyrhizobium forestalis TaxID=1419263 RepID=A0A2M8REU4_9BRAD|nr:hypothetical protein CVM73_05880 [Bradyrhizobium forestalis]